MHHTELVLDISWYKNTPASNTPRSYELVRYPVAARVADVKEERFCRFFYNGRIVSRLPLLPRPWRHYRESDFSFNSKFNSLGDNTYLDGYWQSYRYFENISESIKSELVPLLDPAARDGAISDQIQRTEAVSVHVRRGDYVTLQSAAKVHGASPLAYYRQALQVVADKIKNPCFYVFSDDMEWVRASMDFPGPVVFVDHNDSDSAFQDLRLMSQCRHHIVANSSFSWWGAWLNSREDKLVIAPKKWFMDDRSTVSLTPDDWLRL